ncbi:hypothetical protein BDK51DRAFT_44024 [Blyttiomyces helicus]|uniref:Uncharacterized protein n=1 Tax=Blyttiomyces helicus TaxID=388810 RepID=A0A4P9WMW0_9FUNG|nr:hypothetical protein BDK51DRAFT_44024 [Blyttiomyces helicus]|eukprot:RKO93373.1 hypothetical protein BDK51DRAFT_44024 [Blyttiomyces helicus]
MPDQHLVLRPRESSSTKLSHAATPGHQLLNFKTHLAHRNLRQRTTNACWFSVFVVVLDFFRALFVSVNPPEAICDHRRSEYPGEAIPLRQSEQRPSTDFPQSGDARVEKGFTDICGKNSGGESVFEIAGGAFPIKYCYHDPQFPVLASDAVFSARLNSTPPASSAAHIDAPAKPFPQVTSLFPAPEPLPLLTSTPLITPLKFPRNSPLSPNASAPSLLTSFIAFS